MPSAQDVFVCLSSASLRVFSYIFLRWHFPPLILSALVLYLATLFWVYPDRFLVADTRSAKDYRSITSEKEALRNGSARPSGGNSLRDDGKITPLQHSSAVWTTLLGLPKSKYRLLNWSTILINILLAGMMVDLTYGPKWFYPSRDLSFARVGFVSYDSAKIMVREPDIRRLPIHLEYRLDPKVPDDTVSAWTSVATASSLKDDNDFTAAFDIPYLLPATRYQYRASTNHTGVFVTALRPGVNPSSFTFLHSSCIVPNFPYVPFRHHLSFPGFKHLSNNLPSLKAQFMLFLGDFIYIDVPHRHGTDRESYRREYRQAYASPDWPSISSSPPNTTHSLPWIHVYDDHEIANDWDKNETGVFPAALDPFTHYQSSINPPSDRPNVSYYSFTQGPLSFFLLDTRRYRTPFDGTPGHWTEPTTPPTARKSMLGETQRQDLLTWLAAPAPRGVHWKILVSSIPFTKNWRFGSEDTWAGYLGERKVILEAMWTASAELGVGVVVLSGDRHEFAATKFPPPQLDDTKDVESTQAGAGREGTWPEYAAVHEFSASPLSMFYLPVRTYRQEDREDVVIKYLPDGNSKFGAVTVGKEGGLGYRLFVDGREAWRYELPPPGRGGKKKGEGEGWGIW
ncbi:PhoD-like phosphatase-domain-containing protein [Elsinoe ampelina]|uniref:PhoD-like phosphatase-domain-containing protein n=1 Tax=Elsinoe ampelina TaxID=302913 RepID=A0A6A6G4A8_9PEZI|nr:PhoD-like phosphatase-domain-containing protein [Elsinoe ampelina]